MRQRDKTIDIIKGFAIIAVVLLHINFEFPRMPFFSINSALGGLWHVAVFFVVSGWFLKDDKMLDYKTFVWGKLKNLYLKAMWVYIPLVLLHNVFFKWGWLYDDIKYHNRFLTEFIGLGDYVKHIAMQFVFTHREPFSGAMWFVDSLFLGLLVYGVITCFINKYLGNISMHNKMIVKVLFFFVVATISASLRNVYNLDIPKISNTMSALALISVGQFLGQKKITFDNKFALSASAIVFLQYNLLNPGINMSGNKYTDVVFLITAPVSALYILGYIGKRIQDNVIGKCVNYIGSESFWVMGLHMVGFHIFTSILGLFGFRFASHFTTPVINNVVLLLGYLFFGIVTPLVIISISRLPKKLKND